METLILKIRDRMLNSEKILNYLIIFFAFCLPISKAGVSLAEVLLILFWIIEGDFKRKFIQIWNCRVVILLFCFLLLSFISILWSSDKVFALSYLSKYWHFLVIPVIFTSLKIEYIEKVLSSFLFGILISVLFSFGIFFEIFKYKNVTSFDPSPFMDHTNYGIYLSIAIFLTIYKAIKAQKFKEKIVYIFLGLIILIDLFLISGRTGQVTFLISIIILSLSTMKKNIKFISVIFILVIIIATFAYDLSETFNKRMNYTKNDIVSMYENDDYNGAFGQRVSFWIVGASVFSENIFFGTGIGDEFNGAEKYLEKYNFNKRFFPVNSEYMDYHNAFIQYSVQLGILGFILFISLFYSLWKLDIKDKFFTLLNRAFIINFVLLSMVGLSIHIMASMVLFGLFSGIYLSLTRDKDALQ
ncbi:hypothetical protein CRV08_03850 [Halarcobacter ebronensis]|uniref:O-antigen ligase-related domain-containing protein n=1 Tax=Halarcobacter ebronensis TaxID=1462615 RepID=A0A4Q0YG40_9BACT|nr:O-antigen ligase family protein [Halarcobacter ebronensis]RXJ69155.1 hypothetical protein CRV08_03850 [Halarcobacter ebronensis]